MGIFIDITGQAFGRLTVIKRNNKPGHGARWLCQCECGTITIVASHLLTSGHSRSCGCLQKDVVRKLNTTHDMTDSIEYSSWQNMKNRCFNKTDENYCNYGARGITVCDRWAKSFEAFFGDMGPRQSRKYSLDRKNNNGNYEPGNCRWADDFQQAKNQRIRKDNTSGTKGVNFHKATRKWAAAISINKKRIYLGVFNTKHLAVEARESAEQTYWSNN